MNLKLHQVLALRKGVAEVAHSALTTAHHTLMKTQLLAGISKTYRPKDEDGDHFPSEYQKVVLRSDRVVVELLGPLTQLLNVTAQRDYTNMVAKADVKVEGVTLIKDAPVPYLLWLEEQLKLYTTLIKKLPVLSPETDWSWSTAEGVYASTPTETVKTKKTEFPLLLHPGTDKHPPQVKISTTDEVQGYWTTVRFSGAFEQDDVNEALDRVQRLHAAVRVAQGEANSTSIVNPDHGEAVLAYLLGPLTER